MMEGMSLPASKTQARRAEWAAFGVKEFGEICGIRAQPHQVRNVENLLMSLVFNGGVGFSDGDGGEVRRFEPEVEPHIIDLLATALIWYMMVGNVPAFEVPTSPIRGSIPDESTGHFVSCISTETRRRVVGWHDDMSEGEHNKPSPYFTMFTWRNHTPTPDNGVPFVSRYATLLPMWSILDELRQNMLSGSFRRAHTPLVVATEAKDLKVVKDNWVVTSDQIDASMHGHDAATAKAKQVRDEVAAEAPPGLEVDRVTYVNGRRTIATRKAANLKDALHMVAGESATTAGAPALEAHWETAEHLFSDAVAEALGVPRGFVSGHQHNTRNMSATLTESEYMILRVTINLLRDALIEFYAWFNDNFMSKSLREVAEKTEKPEVVENFEQYEKWLREHGLDCDACSDDEDEEGTPESELARRMRGIVADAHRHGVPVRAATVLAHLREIDEKNQRQTRRYTLLHDVSQRASNQRLVFLEPPLLNTKVLSDLVRDGLLRGEVVMPIVARSLGMNEEMARAATQGLMPERPEPTKRKEPPQESDAEESDAASEPKRQRNDEPEDDNKK